MPEYNAAKNLYPTLPVLFAGLAGFPQPVMNNRQGWHNLVSKHNRWELPLNVSVSNNPVFVCFDLPFNQTNKSDYGKEKSKRRDAAGVCAD